MIDFVSCEMAMTTRSRQTHAPCLHTVKRYSSFPTNQDSLDKSPLLKHVRKNQAPGPASPKKSCISENILFADKRGEYPHLPPEEEEVCTLLLDVHS